MVQGNSVSGSCIVLLSALLLAIGAASAMETVSGPPGIPVPDDCLTTPGAPFPGAGVPVPAADLSGGSLAGTSLNAAKKLPIRTTVPVTTRPATTVTTVKPSVSETGPETTGNITVISSPAGASILIDGIFIGNTPGTVSGVPAGNHILRLSLSGYTDYEGSIYIIPGKTNQAYGTLHPRDPADPAPAVTVPPVVTVIVPVPVTTPQPAPGTAGLPMDSAIIVALIGAVSVCIAAGASIFIHERPPKE